MECGLHIGASEKSVVAARAAILDILNTEKCGDAPKIEAVKSLVGLCSANNATIQNCVFHGVGGKAKRKRASTSKNTKSLTVTDMGDRLVFDTKATNFVLSDGEASRLFDVLDAAFRENRVAKK